MLLILPFILLGVAVAAATYGTIAMIIIALIELFKDKKTLLTGPQGSGKTTFLQYLSDEKIPSGPSGAPRKYKIKDAMFDVVTDFSGADVWLHGKFDEYINDHDFVLFFFDVAEFIKDRYYRLNVSARLEKIYEHKTSQKILLIGTHIDKTNENYKYEVEQYFSTKGYKSLLERIVYVDTTNKECVRLILDELKK